MDEREPRNQEGQPPTRSPDETARRLEEKAEGQLGQANRERTGGRIDEVTRGRPER